MAYPSHIFDRRIFENPKRGILDHVGGKNLDIPTTISPSRAASISSRQLRKEISS